MILERGIRGDSWHSQQQLGQLLGELAMPEYVNPFLAYVIPYDDKYCSVCLRRLRAYVGPGCSPPYCDCPSCPTCSTKYEDVVATDACYRDGHLPFAVDSVWEISRYVMTHIDEWLSMSVPRGRRSHVLNDELRWEVPVGIDPPYDVLTDGVPSWKAIFLGLHNLGVDLFMVMRNRASAHHGDQGRIFAEDNDAEAEWLATHPWLRIAGVGVEFEGEDLTHDLHETYRPNWVRHARFENSPIAFLTEVAGQVRGALVRSYNFRQQQVGNLKAQVASLAEETTARLCDIQRELDRVFDEDNVEREIEPAFRQIHLNSLKRLKEEQAAHKHTQSKLKSARRELREALRHDAILSAATTERDLLRKRD